jgi:hypothetical protein
VRRVRRCLFRTTVDLQRINRNLVRRQWLGVNEYDWDNSVHGRTTERWLFMVGHQLIENPSELITLASSQHSCDHGLSGPLCGSPGPNGSTPRSAPSCGRVLGIIFLPFATLIYLLLYTPGRGLSGWDWFWFVLAALLDIGHWGASATQRNKIPGRRASEA